MSSLTPKEKIFLKYVEGFCQKKGYSPSFTEIKEYFNYASIYSVQKYINQLQKKGYIYSPGGNQKRALRVLKSHKYQQTPLETESPPFEIPFLGKVAAGEPIEHLEFNEAIDVSSHLRYKQGDFALEVSGLSMKNEGIFPEDVLLVRKKSHYDNGELVIARIGDEVTVKRLYRHEDKKKIELRPSHDDMESFWYDSSEVYIEGSVASLMRKF